MSNPYNICSTTSQIALGFISGKKKATIPWAKVTMDPSAWMHEECYPSGFRWADPSKIRVGQVFHLLDHWRQRKESGLAPLIWNSSCELLADVEHYSEDVRNRRQIQSDHSSESDEDEEDFANQLAKISEDDSESPSPPPSPSPHPMERGLGDPEPDEPTGASLGSPTNVAPLVVPQYSCKSDHSLHALHPTYLLYIVLSDHEQSSDTQPSKQAHTELTYTPGEHIINSSDIFHLIEIMF